MIKCICFDMDNTIYPEASYFEACYREIARMISPSDEEKISRKMTEIRQVEGDSKVFQKIIDLYNIEKEYINQFVEIYRTCNAGISLFPDAKEYLNNKSLPVKYGILTNGGKMTQRNKLRCLGVEDKFDFIFITGEVLCKENWKPNKKAFDLVISNTDVEYNECLYVGDSFEKDVIGALNVGMNAVLFDRKREFGRCEHNGKLYWMINNFDQLHDIVREIEG